MTLNLDWNERVSGMWKRNDIVVKSREKQERLSNASAVALDFVTSAINRLTEINDEIDSDISEINANVAMLGATVCEMDKTKKHNEKVIAKFKAMIEE